MSLADRLSRPAPPRRYPVCSIGVLLSGLADGELEALRSALADGDWTASRISAALKAEGHQIGDSTVRRHRRGECSCEPR